MAALVRRASSSVLIPLAATRSPGSSLFVHHLRNLLSTTPSDKVTPVSIHNLSEKIDDEMASYSNEGLPVPSGFPFYIDAYIGRKVITLTRRYLREENISVRLIDNNAGFQGNGDDPFIPLDVKISKKNLRMASKMTVKPNRLLIHQVIIRSYGTNMEDYREYLKTKGITSKTISLLYRCLGHRQLSQSALPVSKGITEEQKRALGTPVTPPIVEFSKGQQTAFGTSGKLALLDGLPFDSIKDNGHGTTILRRKTEDEIIKIHVNPVFYRDPDGDQYFYFDYDDDEFNADDFDDDEDNGGGGFIVREKVSNAPLSDAPLLALYVKILCGSNFNRCLAFLCHAYPDDHDKIDIDEVSIRNAKKSGVIVGEEEHLVEFEDFYKERGIEPCNLNFLFSYLEKRKEMKKYCESIGKKVRALPWESHL